MKNFPWTSVDSASWLIQAAVGAILLPSYVSGSNRFDYSVSPLIVAVSSKSSHIGKRNRHYKDLGPDVRRRLHRYLKMNEMCLGTEEKVVVEEGYRLGNCETWAVSRDEKKRGCEGTGPAFIPSKKFGYVIRPIEVGVSQSFALRGLLNAKFVGEAESALPLEKIYLAGSRSCGLTEAVIRNRLMSFVYVNSFGVHHARFLERCKRES
jgi:hypothetical protein